MKILHPQSILFIFFTVLLLSCNKAPTLTELEDTPIPDFKEPKIKTHTFKNGLKLYFLKNRELPIFEMGALIEVGSIDDPAEKLGLNKFMMSGLRTGGSQQRTGDEVDQALEQVAARLVAKTEKEYSTLKIRSLIKDVDLSMEIFFDLLANPGFEIEKLGITRKKLLEGIRRRNEKPMKVANREFLQQLYGDKSVWARLYSAKTINSIQREDIVNFYQEYVASNKVKLAVSGDISFKDLISKIKPYMEKWPKRKVERPSLKPVKKEWVKSVNTIEVPVNQSAIVAGHFGAKRFNPDKYALILANFILGGTTFGSKLGRIRTTLGLAYSVYSDFGFNTDYGAFRVFVSTKTSSTIKVVQEIKKIMEEMIDNGEITEKDLDHAKKSILNKLIFQYEDPFDVVATKVRFDYYGYPPNYLSIYQREIKAVTLNQIKKIVKKYFFPEKLKVMIVGDRSKMGDLSPLGKVEELPLDHD